MPEGRVVGEMPIDLRCRMRHLLRRLTDFDQCCGQCIDANHTAALHSRRLVVVIRGD